MISLKLQVDLLLHHVSSTDYLKQMLKTIKTIKGATYRKPLEIPP